MAGKYRNTNTPKDAVEKKLTIKLSGQADKYINRERATNMRSYAAQIIYMLELEVKVELYKEALDRNMPEWRKKEKAPIEDEIRKIIAETNVEEFEKKLDELKKEKRKEA